MHFGIYHRFKKLATMQHKCCICGEYSECTIESWRRWFNIFFIPIFIVEKGFLFTWGTCGHSMGMDDQSVVNRYREEHEETGLFIIPPCNQLKPLSIERPMPFNFKNILILSSMLLIIVLAIYWVLFMTPR